MSQIVTDERGQQHAFPDDASPEQIADAMRSLPQPESLPARLQRGVVDSATLGLADEVSAAGAATGDWLARKLGMAGAPQGSWNDRYNAALDIERQRLADLGTAERIGTGIVGGLVTGPAKAARGALGAVAEGVGLGAAYGAGSAEGGPEQRLQGGAFGGATGGAVAGIGATAAHLFGRGGESAQRASQRDLLRREGVELTPGQMLGPSMQRTEARATSTPVLGDGISAAQGRTVESFNRAALNRALAPIGETTEKIGQEGIEAAHAKLSDAFEALKPALAFNRTQAVSDDIAEVARSAMLARPQRARLNEIINEVAQRDFKDAEHTLGHWAYTYQGGQDPDKRALGAALHDVLDVYRDHLTAQNPQAAAELRKLNTGWRRLAVIRDAASKSPDGIISPELLDNTIRAGARRGGPAGKFAAAEGRAEMQDLSAAGREIIGRTYPDSGTAGRALQGAALGGAIAATSPTAIAGAILGGAAYRSPAATRAMSAAVNAGANLPVSRVARHLAPVVGGAAGRTFSAGEIADAIEEQESGGKDYPKDNGVAYGPMQITPDTWRRYAWKGEEIGNPAHNRAVGRRIVADLFEKYDGDARKVASAYFSGQPDFASSVSDKFGKRVHEYVGDIERRLGEQGKSRESGQMLARLLMEGERPPVAAPRGQVALGGLPAPTQTSARPSSSARDGSSGNLLAALLMGREPPAYAQMPAAAPQQQGDSRVASAEKTVADFRRAIAGNPALATRENLRTLAEAERELEQLRRAS